MKEYLSEVKGLVYGAILFLNINIDIVKILLLLMLFDIIFGVAKAFVLNKQIRFSIMFKGVVTKVMLLLLPMVLALVAKGIGYDFKLLPDTFIKLFIVAEGFSIVTSCYVIKTGKEPEEVDLISAAISFLRNFLLNFFNALIKKNNGQS